MGKRRARDGGDDGAVAAPPKRARHGPRRAPDESGDERDAVRRARPAAAAADAQEGGDGGEDEEGAVELGDDAEEEDDDGEFEEASPAEAAARRTAGHALAGVLDSVRLDRFMSHECFEYRLGPNVNIINGPNGSGKSAIVAAVQIGLGARSTATDRASRLDEHIMYGKPTAVISIKIRNRVNPADVADPCAADVEEDVNVDVDEGEDEGEGGDVDGGGGDDDDDDDDDDADDADDDDDDDDDDETSLAGRKRATKKSAKEATAQSKNSPPPANQNRTGDADTYKHDVFGDAITVERTLIRGGGTRWVLRDHKGKKVSEKAFGAGSVRLEVTNICDFFGFLVDNPVAVLTQNSSKKFLAEGKPTSHHELFLKATLLGPLAAELNETKKICEQIKLMLAQKKEHLPAVEKQITDLRVAHDESKEMKTLGDRIREMEVVYAWTVADEEEGKLTTFQNVTRDDFEVKLAAVLNREKKLHKELSEANEDAASGETTLAELKAKAETARDELAGATKQHKMRALELARKKGEVKSYAAEIVEKEAGLRGAERELEDGRNAHVSGQAQKAHLADDLRACSDGLLEVEAAVAQAQAAVERAEDQCREAAQDVPRLENNLQQIASAHDAQRRQAAEQRKYLTGAHHVGRFGPQFPKVMPLVERYVAEGRFHYPPVGPIGQYVTVKDEDWAPTIQDAIHPGNLTKFLVGDKHDMDLLRKVFSEARAGVPRVTVIHGGLGHPRHSIPADCLPRVHELGHCTVMDQLEVSNSDVFNMLVDQCQMEGNVLVRGNNAMVAVSRNRTLANVRMCWDEEGNRAYERNRSHTVRGTERRRGAGSVLGADREGHVRGLEAAADQLMQERRSVEEEVKAQRQRVQQLSRAEREAQAQLKRARQQLHALTTRRADLEDKMNEAASEFDSQPYDENIAHFAKDVEEARREKAAAEATVATIVQNLESAEATRAERSAVFEKLRAEVKDTADRLGRVGNVLVKSKGALRRIGGEKSKAEETVRRAHVEIAQQQVKFTKAMEDARSVRATRPDMEAGKSSEKVDAEVQSAQRRLKEEEERRDGKSAEDIEEEYLQAKKKFLVNQQVMRRIKGYHKSLLTGLEARRKEKALLVDVIKKRVRVSFNKFLGTRGHRGKINFKTNEKGQRELIISTQMATHKTGDGNLHKTKDLRSLSGGERSYTTLSFMLALADVSGNPVRIMDEPDVFMDEASRNAAFRSLIEFCTTELADKQVVLVTPLTLPAGVNPGGSVHIVRLDAVRRSRGGGGGTQTRIDQYVNPGA